MDVIWNELPKGRWDRLAREAGAPLPQDWAYGEAMAALGGTIARAEIRQGGRSLALAQVALRRVAGVVGFALCTRGPVWLDAQDLDEKAAVLRALRARSPLPRPRLMAFTPDDDDADGAAIAGRARLTRIMTGPASAVLDLTADLEALRAGMRGKWRNRLRAAEREGLRVATGSAKPADYDWLLRAEAGQRRNRRYRALPTGFTPAFQAARGRRDAVRIVEARRNGRVEAAMLFLKHGGEATYHIGWTSPRGRVASAHNQVLWEAIVRLKDEGVTRLDLGTVDTDRSPGLARFKLGVGARPVLRAGVFV